MSFAASLLRADRSIARQLFRVPDDDALRAALEQVLTETADVLLVPPWRAIQRTLNEGSLDPSGGTMPLNQSLLGGRQLYQGPELCVSLVRPDLVPHLSRELQEISRESFQQQLRTYGAEDEEEDSKRDEGLDEDQIWETFCRVREFYRQCSEGGHSAVFVAELD